MWKRLDAPRAPSRGPPLADPPTIKELVRREVEMLLQTLCERSRAGGRYVETCATLSTSSSEDRGISFKCLRNRWGGWLGGGRWC